MLSAEFSYLVGQMDNMVFHCIACKKLFPFLLSSGWITRTTVLNSIISQSQNDDHRPVLATATINVILFRLLPATIISSKAVIVTGLQIIGNIMLFSYRQDCWGKLRYCFHIGKIFTHSICFLGNHHGPKFANFYIQSFQQ